MEKQHGSKSNKRGNSMRGIDNFIVGLFRCALIFGLTYWLIFDRTLYTFIFIFIGAGPFLFASAIALIGRLNRGEYGGWTWLSF